MRTYTREYSVKETFPVEIGERWAVREHGRVVEDWEVIDKDTKKGLWFVVEITEYLGDENAVYRI